MELPMYPQNWIQTGKMPSEDTQFKAGVEWKGNAGGRPKGTMKSYLGRKFMEMSDEDKERFLSEHKVDGKSQIEFGEGKAKQDMDINAEVTTKVVSIDE